MMLNHPLADVWPRSFLIATLRRAIMAVCSAALLVPLALVARDSGFANKTSIAIALTAGVIVLGCAVIGWRRLVLRHDQGAKPATQAIAATGRFAAISLPPARRGQDDWRGIDCEMAPGLPVETDEHRPWTFADALIEWTCTGTQTADERPSTNPPPSSGDEVAVDERADEARLRVTRSAQFATLGVTVAQGTSGLAEQITVAADGLGRLLSCCRATDQNTVIAHRITP